MDRNTQVEIVNTCIVNALRIDEEHRMMIIEKITQNLTDENRAKLLRLLNVVATEGKLPLSKCCNEEMKSMRYCTKCQEWEGGN